MEALYFAEKAKRYDCVIPYNTDKSYKLKNKQPRASEEQEKNDK